MNDACNKFRKTKFSSKNSYGIKREISYCQWYIQQKQQLCMPYFIKYLSIDMDLKMQ